ncbi:MAG TPA: RNase adapter RapZ [Clostridia bacterium]|nr:RNase adapter RapZ [Clostridia bacterium]
MDITIVTGLSGSGKSMAAKMLEDRGFFCIDNMPPQLLVDLVHVLSEDEGDRGPGQIALVMDTRNPHFAQHLAPALEKLKDINIPVRILFLESSDAALINRYKQSRRDHPMARDRSLAQAIAEERRYLTPVKELAHDILDTSDLPASLMRERLHQLFKLAGDQAGMAVFIQSFGFKYGLPPDSDIVMDVRFVPNPFYYEELKALSGLDQPVIDFLQQFPELDRFLGMQKDLLAYLLPFYVREGKQRLNLAVGCTGGRHRSVMVTEDLSAFIEGLGYQVITIHRDLKSDVRQVILDQLLDQTDDQP